MPSYLLALETATDVCSVALLRDDAVIVELTLSRPRAHAENLVPLVQDALRYGQVTLEELDAVAVSSGPGSYTGLRIGTSTAKGLATAADLALVAVPTLEALAAGTAALATPGDVIYAALQARRREVYLAAYAVTDGGDLEVRLAPAAVAAEDAAAALPTTDGTAWLTGEGAATVSQALAEAGLAAPRFCPPALAAPSAGRVGLRALQRLRRGETEDVAAFEPAYLKAFVAKKPSATAFEKLAF